MKNANNAKGIFIIFALAICGFSGCTSINEGFTDSNYILESATLCKGIEELSDGGLSPIEPTVNFNNGENLLGLIVLKDVWTNPNNPGIQFRLEVYYNGDYDWDYASEIIEVDPAWGADKIYYVFEHPEVPPAEIEFIIYFRESLDIDYKHLTNLKAYVTRVDPDFIFVRALTCGAIQDKPDYIKVPIGQDTVFEAGEDVFAFIEFRRIWVDHQFHIIVNKDGEFFWQYTEEEPRRVNPVWGWENSYFVPAQTDAPTGEFQYIINWRFGDNIEGKEFENLTTLNFVVE